MKKLVAVLAGAMLMMASSAIASPLGNGPSTIDLSGINDLQTVVNNVFGASAFNVQTTQTGVGGWVHSENDTSAFRVIAQFPTAQNISAGYTNATVGVYDLQTGLEANLFNLITSNSSTFQIYGGDLIINGTTISSGWSGQFGFYTQWQTDPKRYTEDSKNGGINFSATYLLKDGTQWNTTAYSNSGIRTGTMRGNDDFLIAMESDGGFRDFQDVVFMVEDVAPVPEPGTFALLGAGLLGLGFFGRRRMKK